MCCNSLYQSFALRLAGNASVHWDVNSACKHACIPRRLHIICMPKWSGCLAGWYSTRSFTQYFLGKMFALWRTCLHLLGWCLPWVVVLHLHQSNSKSLDCIQRFWIFHILSDKIIWEAVKLYGWYSYTTL